MLTAGGIGSGLDVESIISQLMALERRPLDALEQKKSEYQSELSAFGQLKSALSTFQDALDDLKSLDDFEKYKGVSADEDVLVATADSDASVGTFDLVVNNLAEAHKVASAQQNDTFTVSGGASDTLDITIGTDSFSVVVGGQTLDAIRDAINSASDNVGVTASILSETSGKARLILTANDTGTANAMTLGYSGPNAAAVQTDLGLSTINAAEDASVLVDGLYTITRSSNDINDAIQGVTLTLKSESASTVNLKIERDVDAVKESVQAFVDAYNSLRSTIDNLRAGELAGDSTLRNVENQIRNVFNTPPTGLTTSLQYLSEVGVSITDTGTLSLDSTDLESILTTDFEGFANLFANDDQGYLFRLDSLIDDLLAEDGLIDAREEGLDSRIDLTQTRIDNAEYRLSLTEQRLRSQFSALDAMLGQMQATSSFLNNFG